MANVRGAAIVLSAWGDPIALIAPTRALISARGVPHGRRVTSSRIGRCAPTAGPTPIGRRATISRLGRAGPAARSVAAPRPGAPVGAHAPPKAARRATSAGQWRPPLSGPSSERPSPRGPGWTARPVTPLKASACPSA